MTHVQVIIIHNRKCVLASRENPSLDNHIIFFPTQGIFMWLYTFTTTFTKIDLVCV